MRSTHNLKKSSSWFWHLLSKSADLSKPWGRFFQILCVSQKVRILIGVLINFSIPKLMFCKIAKLFIVTVFLVVGFLREISLHIFRALENSGALKLHSCFEISLHSCFKGGVISEDISIFSHPPKDERNHCPTFYFRLKRRRTVI